MQLNIKDIFKILPHRFPILLIDKVIDLNVNTHIVGLKNVTYNEIYFLGHFPENPIMPGVLILEAMAQLAAILIACKINATHQEKLVYLTSVENAKFRKVVLPGDVLKLTAQIKKSKLNFWKFNAIAMVEDCLVSEGDFTAMTQDKN